jgi:hypothetical protein
MYISEQLLDPDERRLRLSTQLGVEAVVIDNRGTDLVSVAGGVASWDAAKLRDYRRWVEGFGLRLDVFALDVGSILLDSLVDLDGARRQRAMLADNIRKAADAGIDCLKYNVQMVGITRTALKPGRGWGAQLQLCARRVPTRRRPEAFLLGGGLSEPSRGGRWRQRRAVWPEDGPRSAGGDTASRLERDRISCGRAGSGRRGRRRAPGLPSARSGLPHGRG